MKRVLPSTFGFRIGRLLAVCAALVGLARAETVWAIGTESTQAERDLIVTVDSRWTGGSWGGYYPLRIRANNRSVERTVLFRFKGPNDQPSTDVSREVTISDNSAVQFTLLVPLTCEVTSGRLTVSENGQDLATFSIALPGFQPQDSGHPATLVITDELVDFRPLDSAVRSILMAAAPAMPMHYGYMPAGGNEYHEVIAPVMLPDTWLAYSGVDLVAIPFDTLARLSPSNRSALVHWCRTGGNLLLYPSSHDDQPQALRERAVRLLGLPATMSAEKEWRPASSTERRTIPVVAVDDYGNAIIPGGSPGMPIPAIDVTEAVKGRETIEPAEAQRPKFDWRVDPPPFSSQSLMAGSVTVFSMNPFPGQPLDWAWFLESLPFDKARWRERTGISARGANDHFRSFSIPGVSDVPVTAFLLLITSFSIVIGPLNYLYCMRQRKLQLLVVTIPAIAFGTSVLLFGYSLVAYGISTKARSRSLTLIDQPSLSAVTTTRMALYSGMAPSDGLSVSPETAVYNVWPPSGTVQSGEIDWTQGQQVAGWLRSRTRTQFLTVQHHEFRSRLTIRPVDADRLSVDNGLEWNLSLLAVADESGKVFFGRNIPAGGTATLSPISSTDQRDLGSAIRTHQPEEIDVRNGSSFLNTLVTTRRRWRGPAEQWKASGGFLEQSLQQLTQSLSSPAGMNPGTYFAVEEGYSSSDLGLRNLQQIDSDHFIAGRY